MFTMVTDSVLSYTAQYLNSDLIILIIMTEHSFINICGFPFWLQTDFSVVVTHKGNPLFNQNYCLSQI